jgi:hypothetical protein
MIRILYIFFNKVSSRIVETVLINLLADFIGIMLVDFFSSCPQVVKFFTSYQIWFISAVFLSSLVIVNWLEKSGINESLRNWVETKLEAQTVTQPAKPQQQLNQSPFSKLLNGTSKNVKAFEKRSKQIIKNINHKE